MDVKYPTNNYLNQQKKVRGALEISMNAFKDLIKDKIHPENKTKAYEEKTVSVLNNLLSEANNLDQIRPGEGIFGLIVLCLRTNLKLKDMVIEQEHKIKELELEIKRLKSR